MQSGFVTVLVLSAWLRWDSLAFRFFAKQFLVCFSYLFLVFAFYFFCCGGVGQYSEASALFGCCWLVFFLVAVFHFIPQVVVLLFFGGSFRWTIWLSAFLKTVFKIIPGFAVFAFSCGSFWWTGLIYLLPIVLWWATVTVFMRAVFTFSNSIRF